MKKSLIYLFSLLFIVSLASCVKDDNDDVKEPELENFSDYLGDYRGILTQRAGESSNQIRNLNLNLTSIEGKNKLFFVVDNFLPETRAVNGESDLTDVFTESRLEVDAYVKGSECYFEAKDVAFNNLINVSVMGSIKDEVIIFGGSGLTKENQKVEFSFTAKLNGGFVHDLADVVGDYEGMIKMEIGDSTTNIKDVKSTINTTDKDNQLKIAFNKLNLGAGEKDFEFLVNAAAKDGICTIEEVQVEIEGYKTALLKGEIKSSKEFAIEINALANDGKRVTVTFLPTEEVVDVEYDLTPFVGEYGADALLALGQDEATLKNLKAIVETTDNKNEVKVTFVGVTFNGTTEDVVYISAAKVEEGICTFVEKVATRAFSAGLITGSVDSTTKTLDAKATLTFDGVEGNISFKGGEYIPTPDEKYDLAPFVGEYGADMAFMLDGKQVTLKNVKVVTEATKNNNEMKVSFVDFDVNGLKETISYVSAVKVEGDICTFIDDNVATRSIAPGKLLGSINSKSKVLEVKATILVNGVEASMDFTGGEYVPTPEEQEIDLTPFVGELSGEYNISGDVVNYPRSYARIQSKIEKTGNKNEVRVTVKGLDVNYQMFDLSFTTKVTLLDAGVLNIADDAEISFDIPSATDAKLVKFSVSEHKQMDLSIEATNNNGGILKMSYNGMAPKSESVLDLAKYAASYTGALLGNDEYVVKVSTGNKVNELRVQLDQVDLGAGKENITLAFHVSKDGNGISLERAYRVESGKPFVTFEGSISADKELNLSWTVADNAKVNFVGVVKKDPVKVVKSIGKYSFESFKSEGKFIIPEAQGDLFKWSSSDYGLKSINPKKYSVTEEEGVNGGKSVAVQTFATKYIASGFVAAFAPRVTAGSLFIGDFVLNMGAPLKSTRFGVITDTKVTKVKGFYKYAPGRDFHVASDKPTPGLKDKCSIVAVLYEVQEDAETLDGTNINTDGRIVAYKQITDGNTVDSFKEFELNLEYKKEFDPAKKYKFAIVASASVDGDKYHGAHESKLWLDEIEVFAEVEE